MTQMAYADGSHVHWYPTFLLVLLPGALVGTAFGLAEHRRRAGLPRSGWLAASPVLFTAALLDPTILRQFVTQGIGGGSVGVALAALGGGYALAGRGRAWWRRTCGGYAVVIVLMMVVMASDQQPLSTPRGAWVGVYASSMVALLCVASAIPQRADRTVLVPAAWQATAIGSLAGLGWAASLRGLMVQVAGADSSFDWARTFVWVLLPGTMIGALLGRALWRLSRGSLPHRRWLVWSPMLFGAVLLSKPLDLLHGFAGGVGLSAVAVPALCMAGGYAIAGRGAAWLRVLAGLVPVSAVPIWALVATDVGGPSLSPTTAHGAWCASLLWSLLATFALAAAIPHLRPSR
jgi:hypothetical protein